MEITIKIDKLPIITDIKLIKGKEEEEIKKIKEDVIKLLKNIDIIDNVNIKTSTCDHRYHSKNGRYMLYEGWCEKCGTDI